MTRTAKITKVYRHKGRRLACDISAKYNGGSYIDISFNGAHPSEVINVWDYRAGKSTLSGKRGDVREALISWIEEEDTTERKDTGEPVINRDWLRLYVENS